MKKQILALCSLLTLVLLASCSSDPDSYENLLADEKDAMSSYISRNGINVIKDLPANNIWGPNDYYKTPNGVYIHVVDTGDYGTEVYDQQLIIARYYKISLDINPDTLVRSWTTLESPYPTTFNYNKTFSSTSELSQAFHEAVGVMKRNNSSAKLIVPSKMGDSDAQTAVKPYAYDFKIKLGD